MHLNLFSFRVAIIATSPAFFLSSLHAKDTPMEQKPPQIFSDVVQCRSIENDQKRLACYDERVATLDTAQKEHNLLVVDKEQVRETRKGLFGLTLPAVKIFSGNDDNDEAVNEIEAVIASVQQIGRGQWAFELDNGAQWVQTDAMALTVPPTAGKSKIRIRRAAMGSFMANVDGQRAIRVKRVIQ